MLTRGTEAANEASEVPSSVDEPSTSKPRTTQPAADSDMDDAEPRPSRERHIHYVKASEIEVTRRDLVHAEYSLQKSDCYRQIRDIGEPGVVTCTSADIGHATSVGTITRTKLAATASTSTLHAARKRHTAGLPRSVP